MKKLLLAAAASAVLTSFGAWEKVGSLRVADVDSLVKGVTRLGEFTGNQMLGIMVSQSVMQFPPVAFFGPGRPGAAMSYVLFLDGEKLTGDPEEALGSLEYAVLYPVAVTKAAFIASHPGAVETNGLVRAYADDEDESEGEATYVAFSADGRWAASSDKPEQAKAALADVKMAEKKMDGDLARVQIDPKGWAVLARAADAVIKAKDAKAPDSAQLRKVADLVRQVVAFAAGLRVNEHGLDIRIASRFAKGSDLSKVGLKPIVPDAWKGVPSEAVAAVFCAEDSGSRQVDWDDIVAVLKKHGVELPFLTVAHPVTNHAVFTIDVQGAVNSAKQATNVLGKVDAEALFSDLGKKLDARPLLQLTGPAYGASVVVKGGKPAFGMKACFEATLPEVKGKPVSSCAVASYYSILKAIAPVVLADVEPQERALVESMLAALPPAGKSAVAYATWRENESCRGILRIGADEFKGLSACFSAYTALQMQQAMKQEKGTKPSKPAKAK